MTSPLQRTSSGTYATTGQLEKRHRRAALGIGLMVLGIVFAVPALIGQVLHALHPPTVAVSHSVLELIHEFGFPVLLIAAGYNLFSRDAFADLVDRAKTLIGRGPQTKPDAPSISKPD